MKQYIFGILLILIMSGNAFGQLPLKEGRIFYESVDTVEASRDQIYLQSKKMIVAVFNNSNAAIRSDDKEAGIVSKGTLDYIAKNVKYTVGFSMSVEPKEGRYRIRLYDFTYDSYGASLPLEVKYSEFQKKPNKIQQAYFEGLDTRAKEILEYCKSYMKKVGKDDF